MIKLLITGGTIDKCYNELNGELHFPQTHLPDMLLQTRCTLDIKTEVVMLKDSLEMTNTDRDKLEQACIDSDQQQIVITHGTDTMVQTAAHLARQSLNKTIVLVGAMLPYKIGGSDALFNLGCALTAVQLLPQGIYITMNGKVFDWDKVQKDTAVGVFK